MIGLGIALLAAIPLALIGLTLWARHQGRRLRALEEQMQALRAELAAQRPGATPAARGIAAETRAAETSAAPAAPGPWQSTGKAKTPTPPVPPAEPQAPPREGPPRAVVFRREKLAALGQWLQLNWIYLVSAVSLATAGVFLVQYGVESGLLSPRARIWAALAFGLCLVGAGEYLRRRWGDEGAVATAYLPSVFSSAGIVTLFAAILAARHLYQILGSGTALAGLVATALLAVVLGWFSGPLLAAVGLLGAMAAPLVVGGQSDAPELFYGYFGVVTLAGLLIDTIRRWAWVSVLSLGAGLGAAWMLYLGIGQGVWLICLCAALALAAIAVPARSLLAPAQGGTAILQTLRPARPASWPEFPTNLAAGSLVAVTAAITLVSGDSAATFWGACLALTGLFAALALWAWRAPALEDLAALPGVALLALPVLQAQGGGAVFRAFRSQLPPGPETSITLEASWLVGAAVLVSLLAARRSFLAPRWPLAWAAGAALAAPLMMLALEVFWQPVTVLGRYPWALHAAAIALGLGLLAERFARADGGPGLRSALATLAALTMICFALVVMLSQVALTLALAVTVLAAAALDRRFDMAPLMWFVKLGAVVVSWRLVIDPGLGWALTAPWVELIAGFAGALAALLATLVLLRKRARVAAGITSESVAATLAAVFASVLIHRTIEALAPNATDPSHWSVSLIGLVWFLAAANLIWRQRAGGPLRWLRRVMTLAYLLVGAVFLGLALTLFHPMGPFGSKVLGPVLANTLFVAYGLPALLFAVMAQRFDHLARPWRRVLGIAAAALACQWLGLAIRHLWRGPDLDVAGVTQPELYTYTVALLLIGAGLLYRAIARRSVALRRLAMSVIALTVAKVFLVDASGLTGLIRVFSFLALGLSLAGLAFLNRWAAGRAGPAEAKAETETEPEPEATKPTDPRDPW